MRASGNYLRELAMGAMVVAGLLFLAAATVTKSPEWSQDQIDLKRAGLPAGNFKLYAALERPSIRMGEKLVLKFTFENITHKSCYFSFVGDAADGFYVNILDSQGEMVPLTDAGKSRFYMNVDERNFFQRFYKPRTELVSISRTYNPIWELKPGERKTFQDEISSDFRIPGQGNYIVVVQCGNSQHGIVSNVAKFEVRD
jgi:hypothetical protein